MKINMKYNAGLVIFCSVLVGIAYLLTGAIGDGSGCLGTQSNIHMVTGSSGYFILLTPSDNNTTTLQPTFTWGSYPADLTSYTLQISTDINFTTYSYTRTGIAPTTLSYPPGGTTYPITLDQSTDYYWRVVAVDGDTGTQTIASGAPFKFTTGVMPGTFTLGGPASGAFGISLSPVLTWTAASQVLNYVVQIDTKTSFNKPLTYDTGSEGQQESIQVTTYTMPGSVLGNLTKYYWRVIAENTGGRTIAPTPTTSWSFTTQ
jgi:trimeric autotransporter adhesin